MKLGVVAILVAAAIFATVQSNQVQMEAEDNIITSVTEITVDQTEYILEPTYVQIEVQESTEVVDGIVPEIQEAVKYYTDEDIVMIAKVMWAECRGVNSDTEKACIAWVVLNRVDRNDSYTIKDIITTPNQFAWNSNAPVDDGLYEIAEDVLKRWNLEKNGQSDVGRVLPRDYLWFLGDGKQNYFRNAYRGNYDIWDYSLPSPYDS